jgi:hypothetical protein
MAPLFEHYGVQLWMPEVGGRVDYASEHDERAMTMTTRYPPLCALRNPSVNKAMAAHNGLIRLQRDTTRTGGALEA